MKNLIVQTDFGGDADDAIALAFLIEYCGIIPDTIVLTPGRIQQNWALKGFCDLYGINTNVYSACQVEYVNNLKLHAYEKFYNGTQFRVTPHQSASEKYKKALVLGPANGLGLLQCDELYFQGGYSPNSIKPLPKFAGINAVQSFNPCGEKTQFELLVNSTAIKYKYFIGKNVCHGFTKEYFESIHTWRPQQKIVRQFYDSLHPNKALHDLLAAILMTNVHFGIWNQERPVFVDKLKMSTIKSSEPIYTLIGLECG